MKHPQSSGLSVEEVASTFAALGSEQRLGVLRSLVRAGPKGLTIGALGEASGVTGSTLTHHLRILTQAALVQQTRKGRSTICAAAAFDRVQALSGYLLTECCADCCTTCVSGDGCTCKDHSHD